MWENRSSGSLRCHGWSLVSSTIAGEVPSLQLHSWRIRVNISVVMSPEVKEGAYGTIDGSIRRGPNSDRCDHVLRYRPGERDGLDPGVHRRSGSTGWVGLAAYRMALLRAVRRSRSGAARSEERRVGKECRSRW